MTDKSDLSNKDFSTGKVKLLDGCIHCQGFIKECDWCGEKIEIFRGLPPVNYHEGSVHRCGRPRGWKAD